MILFTESLMEPLKGWVKDFNPTNLRDLGPAGKPKFVPRTPLNTEGRDQRPPMNEPRRKSPKGV